MLAMAFRAMSDHLHPTRPSPPPGSRRAPRLLRSFGRFWYDFVIGDDWKIAAAVAAALALLLAGLAPHLFADTAWPCTAVS